MKIAVFCSANNNINKEYITAAAQLGEWIGKNGNTLVYGGCNSGLMEVIGKATHENGGMTIGVIPRMVEKGGRKSDYVDVDIPCDNLSDRKDIMVNQCDIAIALPGGIGTLDEIFTMAASNTIGYHAKKVILYNISGFWNPLIELINDLDHKAMIRGDWHNQMDVAGTFERLITKMI